MTAGDRTWVRGLKGLVASIVALLVIRWGALAALDIPAEFPPLAGVGPIIFFTTMGALGATGVFGIVRGRSAQPERLFRLIALVVLLGSFMPDVWLLSDGAAEFFPGATPTGIVVLMTMHAVAAVVIVWFLTSGAAPKESAVGSPGA